MHNFIELNVTYGILKSCLYCTVKRFEGIFMRFKYEILNSISS
jgi:hypothetical protein